MRIIGNNPAADNAEITAVASGALPNGKPVIVNANGTVSVVGEIDISQAVGSPVVFESTTVTYTSSTFDSNAQKVVVAYSDSGNSYYGTAVVGTVSGTSISFGTPVVFATSQVRYVSTTYDSNAQKVVIAYHVQNNSKYGTAIVGTVSGTGISFGTAVVFESARTEDISTAYDSNAQKIAIIYRDRGNSGKGTGIVGTVSGTGISFGSPATFPNGASVAGIYISATYDSNAQKVVAAYFNFGTGTAIVATVSGTSISFGTPVVFGGGTITYNEIVYDSNAQKVVVAYNDSGNSGRGTAIVGTVSGTGISFGSAVVFESSNVQWLSAAYDSNAQKVVISYHAQNNSGYGTAIVGTVSGTGISFGSSVVFETSNINHTSSTYDSNAQKVVISYADAGSEPNYEGTSVVFRNAYTSTNLTAENYIGIANGAAANGGTSRVQVGSGINGSQSSLTAGQQYFVQTNGTLGLTAADPSVIAGTAISATEIIVKG